MQEGITIINGTSEAESNTQLTCQLIKTPKLETLVTPPTLAAIVGQCNEIVLLHIVLLVAQVRA